MLEKPDLSEAALVAHLDAAYALRAAQVAFLPLGADVNTAVYRVTETGGGIFFLKLRRGVFDEITLGVPDFLHRRGISAIIAPIRTSNGELWATLPPYASILYPFVEGKDGYAAPLTEQQWLAFGEALRGIHAAQPPPELARMIPVEDCSPRWRRAVQAFLAQVEQEVFDDAVAAKLAAFMKDRRSAIEHLVRRTDELARTLRRRSLKPVMCHADIHPGNLLLGRNGELYIVDWDNPILAPKERDLALIGGSAAGGWDTQSNQELFYRGYGTTVVDSAALAFYRYERIIEDIAAFCEQLLLSVEGGEDREQSYRYFTGQFLPGHEIDLALAADAVAQRDARR